MKNSLVSILYLLLALPLCPAADAPQTNPRPTIEKNAIEGTTMGLKVPAQPAPGKPWLWVGEFAGHLGSLEDGLVAKGWHVAWVNVSNQFGSPRAMAIWEKVYEELHGKRGLAARPALLGISRGGLYVNAWTRLHPDRVSVLYLDNGVCDIRSWPGGFQLTEKGRGSGGDWNRYKTAFKFASDDEAKDKSVGPTDGLAPAIKNGVFLISVHGAADHTVPYVDNAKPVVDLWEKSGGRFKIFPKEGGDHHPHGLPDPAPLIDLLSKEANPIKAEPKPSAPPNILFLFTDDQRHDTIHALGNDAIRTPNLDRLVRGGTAFRNAYIMGGSSPAVCSPSRACLMSGRTLWNIDCQGEYRFEISAPFKTLPQVFRENGYVVFGTGKNEPGRAGAFGRSFSAGDKILFRGMTKSQYKLPLCAFSPSGHYPGGVEVMHEGKHSAEVYADTCIRFLGGQGTGSQPFFAYVAFQTPHDPRQCPPDFRAMYKDEEMKLPASFLPRHPFDNGMLDIRDEKLAPFPRTEQVVRKHLADYYAAISHTDAQIGRILEALEISGKRENTIVVFSSDNGLAMGSHGLMGKQNIYDHSVHVPLVIAGPGIPKGATRDALCYIYDLYPALCERAGLKTPDTVQFQSLNNVIDQAGAESRDHLYFAFMSWQRAVRDKQYKLIEYCVGRERHTQLFNLLKDPQETRNLAADPAHSGTLARLRKLLFEDRVRHNDGNTPFPFSNRMGRNFWSAYDSAGN